VTILRPLADRLAAWRGDAPPLSEGAVARHFRRQGWDVAVKYDRDLALFARHKTLGLFGVCLCPDGPSHSLLVRLPQLAAAHQVTVLVLSGLEPARDRLDTALDKGVVLMRWPDLDGLAEQVRRVRGHREASLVAAKRQRDPRPSRPGRSIAVPLTEAQRATGFFFQTEHVSCWFADRGGDTLLATFAQWGSDPERPTCWGEGYGRAAGFSSLGFETSSPNWFPEEDMRECLDAAEAVLGARFPTRLLVGASQGGHAALRHGAALRATAVLAFSPAYSIDPVLFRDSRFGPRCRPALNSGMHVAAGDVAGRVAVVFDPRDADDAGHAALLGAAFATATPPPILLPLAFCGHSPAHLLGVGTVLAMLAACRAGDSLALRRTAAGARRHPTRAYLMALWLTERRPATAFRLFVAHRDAPPGLEWRYVCYRLAQAGWAEMVLGWLTDAASANPDHADLLSCVALVAMKAGRFDDAVPAIRAALRLRPLDEGYQHTRDLILRHQEGVA